MNDLRHTCGSLWLGAGADPKVVQRILGHASAAMTMDFYGHLIDHSLWDSATRVGASDPENTQTPSAGEGASGV
jgi:site-specific recombinase XerD